MLSCKPCHLVISPHLANSTSEATHALVATLATCRVRVAGVTRGRKGHMRSEEGERSLAIAGLRRRLGVLTVRCQAMSLLGRLEVLGPGATAAAGRRWQAAELESCWRREERAHTLASAQGWKAYRQLAIVIVFRSKCAAGIESHFLHCCADRRRTSLSIYKCYVEGTPLNFIW